MLRKLLINFAPEGDSGTGGAKDITGEPTGEKNAEPAKADPGAGGEKGTPAKSIDGDDSTEGGDTKGKDKKGEGESDKDVKPPADFKLKLPEGMDEKTAAPFIEIAKKNGLKPEAAQAYFDLAMKGAEEKVSALETEIKSAWEKTHTGWTDEAKKDPEIGGAKYKESVALASKAALALGGDAFVDVLRESKLGKHPAVIKALAKAGKAISEDSIAGLTGGPKEPGGKVSRKAILQRDYPNSPDMWKHLPDE